MNKVFSQVEQVVEQYVHKEEYDTNNNNKTILHIYVDVTIFWYIYKEVIKWNFLGVRM